MNELQQHQKIVDEMKKYVAEVIQKTVNGKLDDHRKEFQKFMESFYQASQAQVRTNRDINQKLDDYIAQDNAWKTENEPYLRGLANLSGSAKIIVWVAVGISSVGGAILVIKNFFTHQ